jgi:hypothetical protein
MNVASIVPVDAEMGLLPDTVARVFGASQQLVRSPPAAATEPRDEKRQHWANGGEQRKRAVAMRNVRERLDCGEPLKIEMKVPRIMPLTAGFRWEDRA